MAVRIWVCLGVSWALSVAEAAAETQILRPGHCAPKPAVIYVLRSKTSVDTAFMGSSEAAGSVAVFLQERAPGWASRRLMARFDLTPTQDESIVLNAGPFCTETHQSK